MVGALKDFIQHRWLFPVAIAANALGVLAFRHFVSLDGPMHLLHADVLRDALAGKIRAAGGMWVDAGGLDLNLGDLMLIGLSGMVHPFLLHKLLAVAAVTVLCLGAWRLARAYGKELNASWLLVLPVALGFVLVLGLFHFIIAAGIAFALCGWWASLLLVRGRHLLMLLFGCAVCTFAHKAGGALTLLLLGVHELVLRSCDAGAWRTRWSGLPAWLPATLGVSGTLLGMVVLAVRFSPSPVPQHEEHHPLVELLTLRPLLLLDSVRELPFRIALGGAFLVLMVAALWSRRQARTLKPGDALLLTAIVLLLASLIRTPRTELLYTTDRAQWLALLLMACWLGTQRLPRTLMPIVAVGIASLHTVRLVYIERRMHAMEEPDRAVMSAARSLEPGALVVPVVLDDHWLARHRTAYAAIGHNGILFTGRDHLRFAWKTAPAVYLRVHIQSPENNWDWIGKHIRTGIPPELRQVLVLGAARNTATPAWNRLYGTLENDFRLSDDRGYARVWTRRTAQ